jgi:hypothetical protein
MADDAPPALVCLIAGESSPFIVEPKGNINIMKLKRLIREEGKNRALSDVDAFELTLWRVRRTIDQ